MRNAPPPDERAIAEEIASAIAARKQIPSFADRVPGFSLDTAYRIAKHLRAIRGEPVVGRKIGFTNRSIWAKYGVDAPMWGDMTLHSLHPPAALAEPISLHPFLEPKVEPEIALKLARVPSPGADADELLASIEWFAPAFEIVHSVYPGWRFTLADCAAMGALHGALFLGPPVAAGAWAEALPEVTLILSQDGREVERGVGANALDGPLSALAHLVDGLAAIDDPLAPGDIITTGTLTDAQDIHPGDRWTATYGNSPFASITATFAP